MHHRARDFRLIRRAASAYALALLAGTLLSASAAHAEAVGTVAAMDGTVEIGRRGAWTPAEVGAGVEVNDAVRTGRPGRVRIVFTDESVLELAEASEITIDDQVFDPAPSAARAAIRLLQGKLRALVSEYYKLPGNSYEIQTENAVAGVRGTTFIVVFDQATNQTDVVGVDEWVEVHGVRYRTREGVRLTTGELSVVAGGLPPTPARRLDDMTYQRYLQGFAFIGTGRPESLVIDHPLVTGALLSEVDRLVERPIAPIERFRLPGDSPLRDAGGVAGEPLPIIDAVGRLRIRLF